MATGVKRWEILRSSNNVSEEAITPATSPDSGRHEPPKPPPTIMATGVKRWEILRASDNVHGGDEEALTPATSPDSDRHATPKHVGEHDYMVRLRRDSASMTHSCDTGSISDIADAERAAQPRQSKATSIKMPSQTLSAVYSAGEYKAGLRLDVLSLQSFMAGIHIAAAGHLFLSLGGGILGATFFTAGYLGVVLTCGELFAADALILVAALLGRRARMRDVLRNWTVSWTLNFAGCVAWACIIGYSSGALEDVGKVEYAIAVAETKAAQSFLSTFLKGIAANFLVCGGMWQATCAKDVASKAVSLFFPVTAFVASGFDYCIANQFFLPVGMLFGANISIGNMFYTILAATLGNIVGGGVFVGVVYWYCFEEMSRSQELQGKIRVGASATKKRERAASTTMRSSLAA